MTWTVGVLRDDYNWRRNITRHKHADFTFRRVYGPYGLTRSLLARLGRQSSEYLENTFTPPALPSADLYHFWRTISLGSKPWVVSTSCGLPFGWPKSKTRRGAELLAAAPCRAIIVNSRNALEWQRRKVVDFPQLYDRIMSKTEILHTPQDPLIDSYADKPLTGDRIVLTLVGHHFFRKGGLETLRVVDRLLQQGAPLELNIVSELGTDPHSGATDRELRQAREIIERHPSIHVQDRLPHSDVLKLFKRSHVGLLPSYVETYGYSVLEAQACGCPTITTDVFAFPELNNPNTGWLINVTEGGYDYRSDDGRKTLSDRIELGLERILEDVLNEPQIVETKGAAALERIRNDHCPIRHAQRLRETYVRALGRSMN